MSAAAACAICGKPAVDDHHVTGRGPDGAYLDPDLKTPLCHDDHELAGDDLRDEGLEKPLCAAPGPTVSVVKVAYRLERAAVFLVRVAEAVPLFRWLAVLAQSMRAWACELYEAAANSGWQPAGGAT